MTEAQTLDLSPAGALVPDERLSSTMQPRRLHEADPMVSMIERIVMDPTIPIDRLERVLAMKMQMADRARQDEDRQARRAYYAAMSACQAELPVVMKNRANEHTRSRFSDLAAIAETALPVIHKHGFATSFQPDGYNDNGELRILWKISHSAGHCENGVGEIPVDKAGSQGKVNKTDTQAFGSTATYGRRYLLCMLFNIATGDDLDGNKPASGGEPEAITEEQVAHLRQRIMDEDVDLPKFLARIKCERLEDIYAKHFDDVVRLLNQRKADKEIKARIKARNNAEEAA